MPSTLLSRGLCNDYRFVGGGTFLPYKFYLLFCELSKPVEAL